MNRRSLVVLALLLAVLLCAGAAAAEEGPLDPCFPLPSLQEMLRRFPDSKGDDAFTLRISAPASIQTGEAFTLSALTDGAEGVISCNFSLYSDEVGWSRYASKWKDSDTIEWTLYVPGTYWLFLEATDEAGSEVSAQQRLTVTGENLLNARVLEAVSQCPEGDSYETALWLHDYIVRSGCYDYDYFNYGADGILMFGRGTCDSYSRGYALLLDAAGVQNSRVTSESHAWTAVNMLGEWYHVDTTWDDPGRVTAPVSGNENHNYFGLNNTLMFSVSSHQPENSDYPDCHSLECNYLLRNDLLPWHDAVLEAVTAQLDQGNSSFTLDLPSQYRVEEDGTIWIYGMWSASVQYGLSSYRLAQQGITYRQRHMQVLPQFDTEQPLKLTAEAHYVLSVDSSAGCLRLPEGILAVEREAFHENAAEVLVIPEGCEQIGALAFAGMQWLDEVHLPASLQEIDDSAFAGCRENLLVVAPRGSEAAGFAWSKGYCLEETEPLN